MEANLIKMKNNELNLVIGFLMELKLKGRESRMRTRFVKQLQTYYSDLILEEQQQLIEEHGERDENGELIMRPMELEDGTTASEYSIKDVPTFNKEVTELFNEEYVVEVTEENRLMLETVSEAVFDYDEEINGLKALQYDRICEIFEGY